MSKSAKIDNLKTKDGTFVSSIILDHYEHIAGLGSGLSDSEITKLCEVIEHLCKESEIGFGSPGCITFCLPVLERYSDELNSLRRQEDAVLAKVFYANKKT